MWDHIKYLNVFIFCKFLKWLGHVMVLLVLGIVGFTWFAVVPASLCANGLVRGACLQLLLAAPLLWRSSLRW